MALANISTLTFKGLNLMRTIVVLYFFPMLIFSQSVSFTDSIKLNNGRDFSCNITQFSENFIQFIGNEISSSAPTFAINKIILNKKGIVFIKDQGFLYSIDSLNNFVGAKQIISTDKNNDHFFSLGLGYGVLYGILGVNVELVLFDNLFLSAGFGKVPDVNLSAYNFGMRYFFKEMNSTVLPNISLLYGTNPTIVIVVLPKKRESYFYKGLKLGTGFSLQLGEKNVFGIDVDAFFNLTSKFDGDRSLIINSVEDKGRISFSIGLRLFI